MKSLDINTAVDKLNRLFSLYANTVEQQTKRPYRISRIKKYLNGLIATVQSKFEIIAIDCSNCGDHFPAIEGKMDSIRESKIAALKHGDYERLFSLRQIEREEIKRFLVQAGIPLNVYFFHIDNKIYKI